MEQAAVKTETLKSEPHVDHSYINDGPAPKKRLAEEAKVRPQFIKEEAATPAPVPAASVEDEQQSCATGGRAKFKCSRCGVAFRNKCIYRTHRISCTSTQRRLIESVRGRPCLYDVEHENYGDAAAWNAVAVECGLTSVGNNYFEVLKKLNLIPMKQAKNMDMFSLYTSSSTRQSTSGELCSVAGAEWRALLAQFVKAVTRKQKWQHAKLMEFVMPYVTDEDVVDDAEVPVHPKRPRPNASQHSQPLDMFFLSMCATTKNLPEYVQLQVKKKIFQAVIEAEEIVAAMHNDQEKNNLLNSDFGDLSPFSVRSNANETWEDD